MYLAETIVLIAAPDAEGEEAEDHEFTGDALKEIVEQLIPTLDHSPDPLIVVIVVVFVNLAHTLTGKTGMSNPAVAPPGVRRVGVTETNAVEGMVQLVM